METSIPCEYEHDFVLVLTDDLTTYDDELTDALFEAGCDDATVSMRSGRVFLTFSRTAASLKEAVLSAIRDVMKAQIGARVLRVDDCNLVTQAEIARKLGRSRQLVHQFIAGIRGPGGFPAPTCNITDEAPLWRWCEVAYWAWQNGMIKEYALRAAQDLDKINSVLDFAYQQQIDPVFVDMFFADLQRSRLTGQNPSSNDPGAPSVQQDPPPAASSQKPTNKIKARVVRTVRSKAKLT